MIFNSVSRHMFDCWIRMDKPEPLDLYGGIMDNLTMTMRLSIIDTSRPEPEDWILKTVRHSSITARLLNLNLLFGGGRLGDFKDQGYLASAVFPQYKMVLEKRQPTIDTVHTRLVGVKVAYDRIIIPEKGVSDPSWLVICTFGRFMATAPTQELSLDETDVSILLHLMAGETAKEIAHQVGMSPRTVEHRLERLRKQVGARSLPHLVTMLIADGFDRRLNFASTPTQADGSGGASSVTSM